MITSQNCWSEPNPTFKGLKVRRVKKQKQEENPAGFDLMDLEDKRQVLI